LQDADSAFVATPGSPDQPALEKELLDAATAVGLRRLVKVSVIGANPEHFVRYARWQAEVEQHLAGLDLPATLLRPNWFTRTSSDRRRPSAVTVRCTAAPAPGRSASSTYATSPLSPWPH
jgi:uncharacterized protein YbjT (DUF2867 family)